MKKAICTLILIFVSFQSYSAELDSVDAFLNKYKIAGARPKSCPLESKKFSDLLAKTEAIKNVFKSNCLQKDDTKMTEILTSVKDIQEELKRRNIIDKTIDGQTILNAVTGNDSAASSNGSSVSALSGIKFSTLFSNITTMIKKNQCNLEDGRVLQMTADLIYDSTQLGLLSGNELGLIVAGGGFIVSSALRLIDMMIKQRFDFEKNNDRQTFIKLNCSFYDIRKDLENQGALDTANNHSAEDLAEVKELITSMTEALKRLEQEKLDQKKMLENLDQQTLSAQSGDVTELKKILSRMKSYLQPSPLEVAESPAETQKLMVIAKLAEDFDVLLLALNDYRKLKISSVPMMDDLFVLEIKKFDQTDPANLMMVMNIPAKEFNELTRAKILFHVNRVLIDIGKKEELAANQNSEIKKVKVAELLKKIENYSNKLNELKKIEERLGRIVSAREYSANDDGSDNMLSLLDNYKTISDQVYGEWGEKFLKFTSLKSYDEIKSFSEKLERFNAKYGTQLKNFSIDTATAPYICQDIQRIKINFKYADSLVQEGYDFIVTNKDLFHTDNRTYYNTALDEETKDGSSSIEKIQRHYRSAILAIKKLKSEAINQEEENKYLSRTFMGNSYIGFSMLEVSKARAKMKNLQEKFEGLNCNKTLVDDIN